MKSRIKHYKKVWKKYNNERKLNSLRYLGVVSFVIYAHFCVVSHLYIIIIINLVVEWIRMKQSFDTANTIWIANISRAEDDAYVYVRNKWTRNDVHSNVDLFPLKRPSEERGRSF